MRLLGLHIEDYGTLANFNLGETELASSPCIVYGLNEAGKTTLLSFIRAVLFGFKTEGEAAKPVRGGRPGGHLLLEAEGVTYRVGRFGQGNGKVVVEIPGEGKGGEEILRTRILRGVSPVLFKNVFAFGVDELRQLEALASSEVNVYIYGAGTGTSPQRLADASVTLDKRAGELFKPRGRVQTLNRLLQELDHLDRQIRVWEQQPGHYLNLKQEMAKLEQQRAQAQELRDVGQRRLDRLEKLIRAREPWNRWQACQAQLNKGEQITSFPQEGLDRPGVLEAQAQLTANTVDEKLLHVATTVEELEEQRSLYRDRKGTLPGLLVKVTQGERVLREKLVDLGQGWDEARVLALDISLAIKGQVEDFARRFREKEQKSLFAGNRVANAQRELVHRQEEKDHLARQLAGLPGDGENQAIAPEEGLEMLEQAALELGQLGHLEEMQELKNNQLTEINQRISHIQGAQLTGASKGPKIGLLLSLGLFTGLVAGLVFFKWELPVLGLGLALVALAYINWAREQRKQRVRAGELQEELDRLEKSRTALEQELTGLVRDQANIREKLQRVALSLTGREILTPGEIPGLRRIWQARLEQRRKRNDLAVQLEKAHYNHARAATELEYAQKERERCDRAGMELEEDWRQWLQAKGLPRLSPAGITEFLALADRVGVESQRLQLDRAQAGQIEAALKDYEGRVNQLAETLGHGSVPREQISVYVAGLHQQLREQLSLARRASELREQLLILAGSAEELAALEQELGSTTFQEHQEEYRVLELTLQENQSAIDHLGDVLADRRQEIKALENGEELAKARQEREMVRETLAAGARQWQVTVLSNALLEMAREKHERERQPAVLDLASRLIGTMTQGRYVRVVAPVGAAAKLEVEEPGGRRVEAACLSRGAAGQLYLAVRLALACHFSRLVVPLPVILDDILVDFDARRLRGSLQVLGRVAQELQVILLTCHQHLLAAAQEELPGFSLINMDPKIASPSH